MRASTHYFIHHYLFLIWYLCLLIIYLFSFCPYHIFAHFTKNGLSIHAFLYWSSTFMSNSFTHERSREWLCLQLVIGIAWQVRGLALLRRTAAGINLVTYLAVTVWSRSFATNANTMVGGTRLLLFQWNIWVLWCSVGTTSLWLCNISVVQLWLDTAKSQTLVLSHSSIAILLVLIIIHLRRHSPHKIVSLKGPRLLN